MIDRPRGMSEGGAQERTRAIFEGFAARKKANVFDRVRWIVGREIGVRGRQTRLNIPFSYAIPNT